MIAHDKAHDKFSLSLCYYVRYVTQIIMRFLVRVRSVSLDSGYHRQNEGHVGESKFEYQSGDRKVGLRRLTNGKDDKESSDESTVESSQTSTLTRSQVREKPLTTIQNVAVRVPRP